MLTIANRTIRAVPFAPYTGAPSPYQGNNSNGIGLEVFVNITNIVNSNTLTVVIEAVDPGSGKVVALLTSATFSSTGIARLIVHPNVPAVANVAAADILGAQFRIRCVHASQTDAMTYGVTANVLFA